MEKYNIWNIAGTKFPTGRQTRVMIGSNGAIKGDMFCQGYVVIETGGKIPEHSHENVESYTIVKGTGEAYIDGKVYSVAEGDFLYIESWERHSLVNNGNSELHMMFCYAPNTIVDHWEKEKRGLIK